MGVLRQDFNERVAEIDEYFEFIKKIESGNRKLSNFDNTENSTIDGRLEKILKSTGFLLLYNIIESTILNSIIDIFDEISIKNISYNQANEHIKKYWIKHKLRFDSDTKKATLANNFHQIISEILLDDPINIVKEYVEYGGSLETSRIKELTKEIGIQHRHFKCRKDDNTYRSFQEIKERRNDLAHGKFSFSKMADNLTYNGVIRRRSGGGERIDSLGLVHFKKFTIELLENYITDIEEYVRNEEYKATVL